MRRKSNLPWLLPCLVSALAGIAAEPGRAQVPDVRPPQPLFASDAPLTLRLEASFAAVKRGGDDAEYSPARLSYTAPDGTAVAADRDGAPRGTGIATGSREHRLDPGGTPG